MSKHKFTDIRVPIDAENPSIIRDEEKCIKCGQCKRVCTSPIGVAGRYDLGLTSVKEAELEMAEGIRVRLARIDGLYARESSMEHRASHENEQLNHLYTEFYGKPLSEKTENLLHTVYFDRGIIN